MRKSLDTSKQPPQLRFLSGTLRQTMLKHVTATMAVLVILVGFLHMGLVGL